MHARKHGKSALAPTTLSTAQLQAAVDRSARQALAHANDGAENAARLAMLAAQNAAGQNAGARNAAGHNAAGQSAARQSAARQSPLAGQSAAVQNGTAQNAAGQNVTDQNAAVQNAAGRDVPDQNAGGPAQGEARRGRKAGCWNPFAPWATSQYASGSYRNPLMARYVTTT